MLKASPRRAWIAAAVALAATPAGAADDRRSDLWVGTWVARYQLSEYFRKGQGWVHAGRPTAPWELSLSREKVTWPPEQSARFRHIREIVSEAAEDRLSLCQYMLRRGDWICDDVHVAVRPDGRLTLRVYGEHPWTTIFEQIQR